MENDINCDILSLKKSEIKCILQSYDLKLCVKKTSLDHISLALPTKSNENTTLCYQIESVSVTMQ